MQTGYRIENLLLVGKKIQINVTFELQAYETCLRLEDFSTLVDDSLISYFIIITFVGRQLFEEI